MSYIDDLVAKYCPDGVEYRTLGEVGRFIRGNGLQKKDLYNEGVPAVHYGQIHTLYGVWTDHAKSSTSPELASRLRRAQHGDLLIATTSEDDKAVAKATAWLGGGEVVVSGDAYIYQHALEPKYISYYFQSQQFQSQKRKYISGTKVRRISGNSLAKILVPVPPLEVQRAIAEMLDKFSRLESELELELEARKLQYEHYRRELFSTVESGEWSALGEVSSIAKYCPDGVRYVLLSDVAGYSTTRVDAQDLDETSFVGVDNLVANKGGRVDASYLPNTKRLSAYEPGDILLGNIRPYLEKIWCATNSGGCSGDVLAIRIRERSRGSITPKFLYYLLSTNDFFAYDMQHAKGAKMPRGDKTAILRYRIPVPPLEVQRAIVEVLDKFGQLESELELELAARRQQYEYYRDKLLTFKELEVPA